MTIDITTFRHGTTNPTYDDNGRQVDSRAWEQMHRFECIEAVDFYNAYRNFDEKAYDTEQELQHKLFYIEEMSKVTLQNLDIKFGDYILEDGSGYWWKILNVSANEVFNNCYVVILRGQRLSNREHNMLVINTLSEQPPTGR